MKGIDRLSDLPDGVLHHILSFLDTKSSVQTCIVSRRWRSLWKYVHVLTFNQSSFRSNWDFEQYVEQVLSLRSDGSRVCKVRTDFWLKQSTHLWDRIMKYAASHGVQELFVCPRFVSSLDVVGSVCSCYQSVKVLQLNEIFVEQDVVKLWPCMELIESLTLTLCSLDFDDVGVADDAFANFPRLETLKLQRCFRRNRIRDSVLKVTGSKLLNLEMVSPDFDSLEIVAPKLQSFSLKIGRFHYTTLPDVHKLNLPSLNRANIKLLGNQHVFFDYSDNDHSKKELLQRCANLFKILHNVQALDLQVETFELLIRTCNSEKHQSSPFKRLKSLNLKSYEGSIEVDQVIRYFLGGSPDEQDKRFTILHQAGGRMETLRISTMYSSVEEGGTV